MERILQEADTCSLCSAVSHMYNENNRDSPGRLTPEMICSAVIDKIAYNFAPPDNTNLHPKLVERMGYSESETPSFHLRRLYFSWMSRGLVMSQHVQSFDPQRLSGTEALFEGLESVHEDNLVLCARKYHPLVSVELLQRWLDRCLSAHELCRSIETSR